MYVHLYTDKLTIIINDDQVKSVLDQCKARKGSHRHTQSKLGSFHLFLSNSVHSKPDEYRRIQSWANCKPCRAELKVLLQICIIKPKGTEEGMQVFIKL